ncbi:MAG: leucine-rich repeat domain-containing protein [Chitinivibrionia bacterium]|nr:leucine-rich repeat domain-containing protein [Chitinivibrionia bacterium]
MKRTYLLAALLAAMLITSGCSERLTDSSQNQTAVRLDLNITSPELAAQIASYRVVVTGPDMDSVIAPLTVVDGRYLEGVVEVPAGRNRRFAVQALDASGTVLYEGVTITDVAVGVDITVTVNLYPDVEMVRLSPRYTLAGAGSTVALQFRVSNVVGLYGLSAKIRWTGGSIQPDSAYLPPVGTSTWIVFPRLVLDSSYLAVGVVQTDQMTPIVDENGDGMLMTILVRTFNPEVAVERNTLTVEVTDLMYLTDSGTTIEELTTDHAVIDVSPDLDQTVSFPDPALENLIRISIHKPTGPILLIDVNQLDTLIGINQGIEDLTGLEYLQGMESLMLIADSIADISPLAGLTNLELLFLTGNQLSDIGPLSNLAQLVFLSLGSNQISDLSPLSGLGSLVLLELNDNLIVDVSPLAELVALQALVVSENDISDISSLAGLTTLQNLDLDYNQISDISALSGLTNLAVIEITDNNISDLSPLVGNSGLSTGDEIYVQNNPLSSVSLSTHIPALQARGASVYYQ